MSDLRAATMDQTPPPALRELMRVATVRVIQQGSDIVPEGSVGTIVHVYPRDEAYEVEFSSPVEAVVLAKRGDLIAA